MNTFDLHQTLPKYIRAILNELEALTNLANRPIIYTHWAEKLPSISTIQQFIKTITIQYFPMPWRLTFLSSHCNTHLCTISQINILSMNSTHSRLIYSLHSPTPLKYIFLSLLSGNHIIVILTLTLSPTSIGRHAP